MLNTNRRNNKLIKGIPVLYAVLLVAVVALMVVLRRCGSEQAGVAMVPHSGGDTIDVAIEYSPLSCYSYQDTLGGFNYDLLRMLSRYSHRPMKFHPVVTLSTSLQGLEQGRYDVLVAQMPVTANAKQNYEFTRVIYIDRQVLVQRRDAKGGVAVKSQLDLAGRTVAIVAQSTMRERIESLSREIGDTIHIEADQNYGPEQLFLRVATGETQFAVINERIAKQLASRYPQVDVSTAVSFSQQQAWALKHGNTALHDSLNAWHSAVVGTEPWATAYRELVGRYF